jgi:hypothetical protein
MPLPTPQNLKPHSSLIPYPFSLITFPAALLLIALHALLALSAASTKSTTFDEPIHFIGGYSYWTYNDYRIHAENGNLSQRIIALPSALSSSIPPGMENDPYWQAGSGYPVAWSYLFTLKADPDTLIFRGRAMVTLASCALALLVFLAAKRLSGPLGGLIALAAYALHPAILANASLMTSDLLAALAFALSTCALWACLHHLTPWRLLGLTTAAASMALIKFSFPLFFPIALALIAITLYRNKPWLISLPKFHRRLTTRRHRATAALAMSLAVTLGVFVLIWAAYGFRYQATSPSLQSAGGLLFQLNPLLLELGSKGKILAFFADHHLLPEAFLYGMAHVLKFSEGRYTLLSGQYFQSGSPWFYPASLFYKTPLPLLALLPLALIGLLALRTRRLRVTLYHASPWLCLATLYMAAAILSPVNLGIRHILPAITAITILLGFAAASFTPTSLPHRLTRHLPLFTKALTLLLCLALTYESIKTWPNYIPYFNPLAGPPNLRYRQFSDSNLDWGQDLPDLTSWARLNLIDLNPNNRSATIPGPLHLSYFGSARASFYDVPAISLQSYFPQPDQPPLPNLYSPGVYAISATRLMVFPSEFGPAWSDYLDNAYVERRNFFDRFFKTAPNSPQRAQIQGALTRDQIGIALQEYETLRFSRFCAFLRHREPFHQINHSILLYQLSAQDLELFFYGPTPGNGPTIHNQRPENRVDLPIP